MHNAPPAPTVQLASSGILERDGRYLLVRRRNPPSADTYAFPGGRAEPGETPQETVVREFLEETGLTVIEPTLFATYDLFSQKEATGATSHFLLSVLRVVERGSGEAVAADDADALGWFSPDEIRQMNVPESMIACINKLERCED